MLGSTHSDIVVRRARLGDAPSLCDVFRDTWAHSYRGIIPQIHLDGMIRRRGPGWWRSVVRSRDSVQVLEFDSKIVGYATCGPARCGGSFDGEIYEIYLLPDFQGLGFGEYLFEACRYRLDQRSLRGLIVWALAENEMAAAFYQRRGGRKVAMTYERLGGARIAKIGFGWDD